VLCCRGAGAGGEKSSRVVGKLSRIFSVVKNETFEDDIRTDIQNAHALTHTHTHTPLRISVRADPSTRSSLFRTVPNP